MDGERGGPITGFLIGIGAIVVFFGLLAVACGACTSNSNDKGHSLARIELIAYHNDCRDDGYCGDGSGSAGDDRGDCDWNGNCGGGYGQGRNSGGGGGNGNRGRHGDNQRGDKNCHSFCGNTIVVPDPTQRKEPPQDQQPQSLACLVPAPWHCDPKPASLTDPRKLPTVIAQIAKSGLDMGQLFATTTIKFVEDLFTALA